MTAVLNAWTDFDKVCFNFFIKMKIIELIGSWEFNLRTRLIPINESEESVKNNNIFKTIFLELWE